MIIFLRHEDKAWKNNEGKNKKQGFDPPIINKDELYNDYFDNIYCSPYLRCRQTADKYIKKCENFKICTELREYLGHHDNFEEKMFTSITFSHIKDLKFKENYIDLENRLINWLHNSNFEKDTLVITHGFCIYKILEYLGKNNFNFWKKKDSYIIDNKTLYLLLYNKTGTMLSSCGKVDFQKNTPSSWILGGKMFRLKTWELNHEEIESAIIKIIPKDSFILNVIQDKDENKKEISCLYVKDEENVEKIRTSELETTIGKISKLRKVPQFKHHFIKSKTIKTTAPLWVTKNMIYQSFYIFNTDKKIYKMNIDGKVKLTKYPVVRMYPTKVIRDGSETDVNVIYVQFSNKKECENDSFIALSINHKLLVKDKNNCCKLLFDEWTKEKKLSKRIKQDTIED